MSKVLFVLFAVLCLLNTKVSAQTIFTGHTLNEDSIPLPGVSVLNKRDRSAAVSDDNGKYVMRVRKGDSLLLTAVGHVPLLYIVEGKHAVTARHYLKSHSTVLKPVDVRNYQFFKDSMSFRNEYRRNFDFRRPKWHEVYKITAVDIHQLYKALSFKSNRKDEKFKKLLLDKEQEMFVNSLYPPSLVVKLTNLQGDSLAQFMEKYRPGYDFLKHASTYDLYEFIKTSYREYSKGGNAVTGKPDATRK